MKTRNTPTRAGMLALLREGRLTFLPLFAGSGRRTGKAGEKSANRGKEGTLRLSWGEKSFTFAVECRALSSPKVVSEAAASALKKSKPPRLNPLVLVPYLSPERLAMLEEQGVSGLDLCGNGVVIVPGEVLVYRTGAPNSFPSEGTIKNVYRRNSSVVARVFLLRPEFKSVNALWEEIGKRGGRVTLPTVSKVTAVLEDDLLIDRGSKSGSRTRSLRLLQPEKLIDLLAENYRRPEVTREFTGKTTLSPKELAKALASWAEESGGRVVRTGASSVSAYAVMAREDVQAFYGTDIEGLLRRLGDRVKRTDRFPNLTLLETPDDFVYFDGRPNLVASPVQTYMELAAGDKRDRETAEEVRRVLLTPLPTVAPAKDLHGPTDTKSPGSPL